MKIGICVGHSRRGDSGAVTLWGESEHVYNSKVAKLLQSKLNARGIDSFVIDDYKNSSYGAGIAYAAKVLRNEGASHAIELHFNSAGPSAHGAEWLHWETSTGGKRLAEAMRSAFVKAFPTMKDRGLKPKGKGARGSTFLRKTHCPAILTEPFFGSSSKDCAVFKDNEEQLAEAYAAGIAALST